MTKTFNIHEFARQFAKEYQFLYDNYDRVAGYDEAVEAFDEFLATDNGNKFICEYVNYRHDFISSDREAAAFMFAFEALGGYDDESDGQYPIATQFENEASL